MPYKYPRDLPLRVRTKLPEHAQHIYVEAFNHAVEEYKDPVKRRGSNKTKDSPEVVAHKVAWSAVKKKYQKENGTGGWVEK